MSETIRLHGGRLEVRFERSGDRLCLNGLDYGGRGFLYADPEGRAPGRGPVGNPLAVRIPDGPHAGTYGIETFRVVEAESDEASLTACLAHEALPMLLALHIEVEGSVVTWRGQIGWNGEAAVDLEVGFPLLSRVRLNDPDTDRALFPYVSGSEQGPLSRVNFRQGYLGGLASPSFLLDGRERGIVFLDENRADFAPDPGACVFRSYTAGNAFPPQVGCANSDGGNDGPYAGVCHVRRFRPAGEVGAEFVIAEDHRDPPPLRVSGDLVDLGPVKTHFYEGDWKAGALWLREQRREVPFRTSPADWYRRATFISEHAAEDLVRQGKTFHALPELLQHKRTLGSDFFHLFGFHNPEVLGTPRNMINRGDYLFAADNLGGPTALRQGIEAVHRAGGRILFYVEGLIVWKRSRIGRSSGREWALMKADGTYDEHYKGFWHMCPSCAGWRAWLAETCAEIVRQTGVDGFFIDSSCATHFHRCFNPAHRHPHPDTWNWGLRRMLKAVREAVDRVNPETVLFVEGGADMAREFADGFIAHGHDWTGMTFTEPYVRFLHPDMRAFESWGNLWRKDRDPAITYESIHLFNAVNGHRIYAHQPGNAGMGELGRRVRRYYDAYPEVCDGAMSALDVEIGGGMARLFEGPPLVLTTANPTDSATEARLRLPVRGSLLFDRVTEERVPVTEGRATLKLAPWEFRIHEIRP